jgi:protein-tyrosine phosphatase
MWIQFDAIPNARDLGGIAVADGRTVRPGLLLRGASLENASDADIARLETEFRLRHIVDLRDVGERAERPNRPVPGAEEHAFPVLPGLPSRGPMSEKPDFESVFRRVYDKMARSDTAVTAYANLFRLLCSCPDGAVFFHCAQGKDRTGIAAILILTALGADLETAKEDYFLSNIGLKDAEEDPMSVGVRPWPREILDKLFCVFPETLDIYLRAVDEAWGGLDAYLRGPIGLTDADFAALRRSCLE